MVNEQYFEQNLKDFLELFLKKSRLHIPGVFAPLPCTVCLVVITVVLTAQDLFVNLES